MHKLKLPPPLKSVAALLEKCNGQLYSFTAQFIQFRMMQRLLITVNIHEDAISLFGYTDYFTTCV